MFRNGALWNFTLAIAFTFLAQFNSFSQTNKFSLSDNDTHKDDVIMTWSKNTPESEMKDDIKAMSDKGITIKYDNIKRNLKEEITSIKVEYSDRKGNKGFLEYNNQKPITTIKFFKNGDEIGFGEPIESNNSLAGNDFINGFSNPQILLKQFKLGEEGKGAQSFSFSFPDEGEIYGQSKSKIMIQKDGKKPLVIEDGIITKGGDDYSSDELEKIKSENKIESFIDSDSNSGSFDLRSQEGLEKYKIQMQKLKGQINKLVPDKEEIDDSKSDFEQTKKEMLKAKEEMINAREELEKAKKEVENSKSKFKTKKV